MLETESKLDFQHIVSNITFVHCSSRLARPPRALKTPDLIKPQKLRQCYVKPFFQCQNRDLSLMPDNRSGLFWSPWFNAFKTHCNNQAPPEQRQQWGPYRRENRRELHILNFFQELSLLHAFLANTNPLTFGFLSEYNSSLFIH